MASYITLPGSLPACSRLYCLDKQCVDEFFQGRRLFDSGGSEAVFVFELGLSLTFTQPTNTFTHTHSGLGLHTDALHDKEKRFTQVKAHHFCSVCSLYSQGLHTFHNTDTDSQTDVVFVYACMSVCRCMHA
jgi:hypothetical protein